MLKSDWSEHAARCYKSHMTLVKIHITLVIILFLMLEACGVQSPVTTEFVRHYDLKLLVSSNM